MAVPPLSVAFEILEMNRFADSFPVDFRSYSWREILQTSYVTNGLRGNLLYWSSVKLPPDLV